MDTRWNKPAGRLRPGLTLPELLVALVVLGALGSLLLARTRAPTLETRFVTNHPVYRSPSPAPPPAYPPPAPLPPVPPPDPDNLLVNGSFEADAGRLGHGGISFGVRSTPGWQISGGTIDVLTPGYWEPAPGQGRRSIDLVGTPGAARIEQTFATEPGREYRFTGWVAHNPERRHTQARAHVFLNGERLAELSHRNARAHNRAMGWQPFAHRFRAAAEQTTLTIADVSGHGDLCGTALDGLSVTPVTN